MRNLKILVVILVMCYAVISCQQKRGGYRAMDKAIVKIKEAIKPLDDFSGEYPDSVIDYFKFYGLDFDSNDVDHFFGTFESGGLTLVGHIYKPQKYKATVFLLHGFFDHCGQLNHLIKYLLEQDYAVACFDLPGHGLSGGERAAIDDFSQYSRSLTDFIDVAKEQLAGPYHFIGHSTGAAAGLDYLFTHQESIFDKVILAAPLVRCIAWQQTKIAYQKKISFIKSIPRIFCKSSSDKEFLAFIKNKDPLQSRQLTLKWVRALRSWNERIASLPVSNKSVKVIQGTSDTVVDWKFNIEFIESKFSDVDVTLIEAGRHELFNESMEIRSKVMTQITTYLNQ